MKTNENPQTLVSVCRTLPSLCRHLSTVWLPKQKGSGKVPATASATPVLTVCLFPQTLLLKCRRRQGCSAAVPSLQTGQGAPKALWRPSPDPMARMGANTRGLQHILEQAPSLRSTPG